MARPKLRNLPDLHHLACPGAEIAVRATPRAASDGLSLAGDQVKITVTAVPENGQANKAVRAVLAAAMGVAPTQLTLVRGASARDKLFRYDGSSRS